MSPAVHWRGLGQVRYNTTYLITSKFNEQDKEAQASARQLLEGTSRARYGAFGTLRSDGGMGRDVRPGLSQGFCEAVVGFSTRLM